MIRRELTADGLVLVRSSVRVELHAADGSIVEGRDATPAERAEHERWESGRTRESSRLVDPRRVAAREARVGVQAQPETLTARMASRAS